MYRRRVPCIGSGENGSKVVAGISREATLCAPPHRRGGFTANCCAIPVLRSRYVDALL